MNNEGTSPDTDLSPDSPPTSPAIPTPHQPPQKQTTKSPASPQSPKSPKSPPKPKSSHKTKPHKPTSSKPKDPRKDSKPKPPSKHKSKSKSKSKSKAKSKPDSKAQKPPKPQDKKSKTPKAKTKQQADELLQFLANPANDLVERYNASKRIHSFILNLSSAEDRIKYATKFLANHEIKDDKIRGVFIDFMCKFATSPKFDGLDSFTVILRPFTQLLVYAIQEKGKKTSTIKRIVYGFAQIYPVMLARLCRVWKSNAYRRNNADHDDDSDEEENGDKTSQRFPKFNQYKAVFDVSQKIVDNILLLLPAKKAEVRDFAIKFAKSMILHTTCRIPTKDKNRFSLININDGHPLLTESQLTSKAKAWLKALTDALNKPRKMTELNQFTKENCENGIKGLFGISKERPRLRTPVLNSLKQWVEDNSDKTGVEGGLYRHNQNMLKEGFKWFLYRDDCRQHHRTCLQAVKLLTEQDLSEYREINKQITIRRKEAVNSDKKHIATQKERTKQREIKLLLELQDEYLVSLAINCCKQFEIEAEEAARLNSQNTPIGDALKSLVKSLDDAKASSSSADDDNMSKKRGAKRQLVPLQLKSLSENEKREIIDKCWHRLLSKETCIKIRMNGKRHIHSQLIAKLYSCTFIHIRERDNLVDELTANFHIKYRIAIEWLYHLAIKKDKNMYYDVLRLFLQKLRNKLSSSDKIFTQFIINLPVITDDALKQVKKYASGDRITLGLSTLRDIILYRPKHSLFCLETLLFYTTDDDYGGEVSGPAIRCIVNKLYTKPKFKSKIEQFACDHFEELQRTPQYFDPRIPKAPDQNCKDKELHLLYKENKQKWFRSELQELKKYLVNHSQLFFALCTVKPLLLITKFMHIYSKCRRNVQLAINEQSSVISLIKQQELHIINNINISSFHYLFIEQVARILTNSGEKKPSTNLFNALVISYFGLQSDNENANGHNGHGQVRVFLPILKYLDNNMIYKLLPALLGQLNSLECKEAIGTILRNAAANGINASSLLVEIQSFAPSETSPHIEKIISLTNYCLGQGAYDKVALSAVLQQLVIKHPIPVLFMRTLIQTLLVYPDLTKYAMGILESLIFRNEIWKNKHLWDGFIRCCAMTQPESYAVLCKLGKPELKSVLKIKPDLRKPLLEYAMEANKNNHLRPYVLQVLKQEKEKEKQEKKIIVKKEEIKKEKKAENISAYRVQFFLNKFLLETYKNDSLFKMENFLKHNFANLLKIDASNIIGVKCHREIPDNIRLPNDTVICEVIFLNNNENNNDMHGVVQQFKNHLQSMDFSSWKIYVGSQYVTIQPLTQQKLLLLIKELGLTLASLDNIAQILKLQQAKQVKQEEEYSDSDGMEVDEEESGKHKRKHKHKKKKHHSKHRHKSKRRKKRRKKYHRHTDTGSNTDDELEENNNNNNMMDVDNEQQQEPEPEQEGSDDGEDNDNSQQEQEQDDEPENDTDDGEEEEEEAENESESDSDVSERKDIKHKSDRKDKYDKNNKRKKRKR